MEVSQLPLYPFSDNIRGEERRGGERIKVIKRKEGEEQEGGDEELENATF